MSGEWIVMSGKRKAKRIRSSLFTHRFSLITYFFFIFILLSSTAAPAQTADGFNPDRDKPLEITADQTLEWHRDNKQYIATGNAIARQGDTQIAADTLTADYRETDKSAFEIYRLTAAGHVVISSQGNQATGERIVYDVDRGVAVMTGNNLRLTSPEQTVTARDSFEYFVAEGRVTAIGDAKVVRGQDTITAERMAAIFSTDSATGKRRLDRLTADGNVVITTPTEQLTGAHGEYVAATDIAALTGGVRITRGPNILEGERAEINLTTHVSRMIGAPAQGGRVRGVFYPGSEKPPAESPVPQGLMTSP